MLIWLKIEYPENIHLIRGNHEAADINALFGFRLECIERMVMLLFYLLLLTQKDVLCYWFGWSVEVQILLIYSLYYFHRCSFNHLLFARYI